MPTYLYKCPTCLTSREIVKRVVDIDRTEYCILDDSEMSRQLCAPAVRADLPAYSCPITGEVVSGRRQHEENLAKHGCRILEPGESQAAAKVKAASDQALDSAMARTAEEFVHNLPVEKRDRLCAELDSGISADTIRI